MPNQMATDISRPKLQNLAERINSPHLDAKRVSLLDVLIVLAERKKSILLITIAVTALAAIVSLLLPKRYTATVTLLPPAQNASFAASSTLPLGSSLGGMA